MQSPLKTFVIYARSDAEYKRQLLLHLRPLVVSRLLTVWHDGDILPGEDWEKTIKKELEASELVVVLVSVHSLNSDFIQTEELRTALDRLNTGLARVLPVVVSPCLWNYDPVIKKMNALPCAGAEGVRPVNEWPNENRAWVTVVEQIGEMAQAIHDKREADKQAQLAEKLRLADEEAAREQEAEAQRQAKIRAREEADRRTRAEAEQREVAEKKRLADEAKAARQAKIKKQEAIARRLKEEQEKQIRAENEHRAALARREEQARREQIEHKRLADEETSRRDRLSNIGFTLFCSVFAIILLLASLGLLTSPYLWLLLPIGIVGLGLSMRLANKEINRRKRLRNIGSTLFFSATGIFFLLLFNGLLTSPYLWLLLPIGIVGLGLSIFYYDEVAPREEQVRPEQNERELLAAKEIKQKLTEKDGCRYAIIFVAGVFGIALLGLSFLEFPDFWTWVLIFCGILGILILQWYTLDD